jgi:hypothetical protein
MGSFYVMSQDFMAGKLPQFPGERPTLSDWMNHLGNIYPEVVAYYFLYIFIFCLVWDLDNFVQPLCAVDRESEHLHFLIFPMQSYK